MKRRIVVLLLTLLALVIAAPSAQAAPPTHERLPADFDGVDDTCGFPVEIHQTGFLIAIQWVDQDGSLRRIDRSGQGSAAGRDRIGATHVYRVPGTYTARACVMDDDGGTGCDDTVVTISAR